MSDIYCTSRPRSPSVELVWGESHIYIVPLASPCDEAYTLYMKECGEIRVQKKSAVLFCMIQVESTSMTTSTVTDTSGYVD